MSKDLVDQFDVDRLFQQSVILESEYQANKTTPTPVLWRAVVSIWHNSRMLRDNGIWQPTRNIALHDLARILKEGHLPKRCWIERIEYWPISEEERIKAKGSFVRDEWYIVKEKLAQ